MSRKCRGRALIINNDIFDEPSKYKLREGSQLDVEIVNDLFTQLHFVVRCLNNLSAAVSIFYHALAKSIGHHVDNHVQYIMLAIISKSYSTGHH